MQALGLKQAARSNLWLIIFFGWHDSAIYYCDIFLSDEVGL
jgi:hypothetical protein